MAGDEAAIGAEGDESALDRIMADRQARVDAVRDAGGDPYPVRFDRTAVAADLHVEHGDLDPQTNTGSSVVVAGRVMSKRELGAVAFAVLQDGSGRIQLFAEEKVLGERMADFAALDVGDWVGASGEVVTTRTGELSVRVGDFTLLSKALRPLPDKWHGLTDTEQRYRRRYVDLMVNPDAMRVARARVATVSSVRESLISRGFMEVETPVLQEQAGGAAARPFVTHHNALDRDLFLRISLELHLKRLLVGGLEKVFEIGRVFRNEGVSYRHNPEFTLLESYEAYADYQEVARMVESLLSTVALDVLGTTDLTHGDHQVSLAAPFARMTYRQALIEHAGIDYTQYPTRDSIAALAQERHVDFAPNASWATILDALMSEFVEPKFIQPTFLFDYPTALSPLAKKTADDPDTVERFELFVIGYEIANAYSELNDPVDQRRRMEEQAAKRDAGDDETELMDEDFLTALEHGMPPAGGLGIGIDRLVQLITGEHSLREVILFPVMRGSGRDSDRERGETGQAEAPAEPST